MYRMEVSYNGKMYARGMGSAFHQLCPRYSGTLNPTAPTARRLWVTFDYPIVGLLSRQHRKRITTLVQCTKSSLQYTEANFTKSRFLTIHGRHAYKRKIIMSNLKYTQFSIVSRFSRPRIRRLKMNKNTHKK